MTKLTWSNPFTAEYLKRFREAIRPYYYIYLMAIIIYIIALIIYFYKVSHAVYKLDQN